MTQTDLARESDVSHPTIQRAERSDPSVSLKTIRSIAEALGCLPEEIYIGYTPADRPVYEPPSLTPPAWFTQAMEQRAAEAREINEKLDLLLER